MAIVKSFACDLCGADVERLAVRVLRVGMPEHRLEDFTRLDVGPECYGEGGEQISAVIRAWMNTEGVPELIALNGRTDAELPV